jgi:DNA-binding response OmpR family regulator
MKILLIEHRVRVIKRIKEALEEEGYTCILAMDGVTGRNMVLKTHCDFVILDSELPKVNGIELCGTIRKLNGEIPILLLIGDKPGDKMTEGFNAGADDCLLIPFDMNELKVRVKVLEKRKVAIASPNNNILVYSDLEMNLDTRFVKRSGKEINLTPREFSLLEYLMRNKGKILSREEIAQNVWNTKLTARASFVNVYVTYLRRKIDKDFPNKLIHTKHWMGYVFKTEDVEK